VRVIIAGSRTITNYTLLCEIMSAVEVMLGEPITLVLTGGAAGVDQMGERWAWSHKVQTKLYPTPWAEHGKAAGPIRNRQMASEADALVLLWDGKSPDSKNMLAEAQRAGLQIIEHNLND
jgi:hypothetical protein